MIRKSLSDPEPRLPVKLDSTSNGEYDPVPLTAGVLCARRLALERSDANARRLGVSRRRFLMSASGTATTLLALNQVLGCRGRTGGFFDVGPEMELDVAAAEQKLAGDEFIFDVQTHHVAPRNGFVDRNPDFAKFLPYMSQTKCGEPEGIACLYQNHYVKEVFMDSDTDVALLSLVPPAPKDYPLTLDEAAQTQAVVERMKGTSRLLVHAIVVPNVAPFEAQLDKMQRDAEDWKVNAWKVYTPWGPDGVGWQLDDPKFGIPMIEKARSLGIKNICAHKGLTMFGFQRKWSSPRDIGVVAKRFPDVNFMTYHSGFEPTVPEGPYNSETPSGVDELVKSLLDNGVAPNSNVYADLGATWRQVSKDPTAAAHVVGKILKYVGEDRVLWGTDAIWFGSPQDQIQAFRAFQISEEFQERFGYPALTAEIKAKVFGLNASVPYGIDLAALRADLRSDWVERLRTEYRADPQPSQTTYGPRTRREFFALLRETGGFPG